MHDDADSGIHPVLGSLMADIKRQPLFNKSAQQDLGSSNLAEIECLEEGRILHRELEININ